MLRDVHAACVDPPLFATESPDRWGPLLDAMLHAAWLVDGHDLAIVAVNGAALVLWGGDADSLVGRPVVDTAVTPEDHAFWREAAEGMAGGIESETLMRRADGATVAVTRRATRICTESGRVLYLVALEDRAAAERRERALEGRMAELEATLDSLADGVLVVDLRGSVRHFNRRFADLWELPDELAQRAAGDAVLDWMRENVVEAAAYMRRLGAVEDAPLMRSRDLVRLHSGRMLERTAVPQFALGRPIGRVYSFREIEPAVRASPRARAGR